MNLKCIAHCFNLISQDIIKIPFAERLLCRCSIVVSFFKASHIAGSLLRNAIEEKKIQGSILKTYIKTRWTNIYDCINSVLRYKEAFNYVSYLTFILFFEKLINLVIILLYYTRYLKTTVKKFVILLLFKF